MLGSLAYTLCAESPTNTSQNPCKLGASWHIHVARKVQQVLAKTLASWGQTQCGHAPSVATARCAGGPSSGSAAPGLRVLTRHPEARVADRTSNCESLHCTGVCTGKKEWSRPRLTAPLHFRCLHGKNWSRPQLLIDSYGFERTTRQRIPGTRTWARSAALRAPGGAIPLKSKSDSCLTHAHPQPTWGESLVLKFGGRCFSLAHESPA